MLTTERVAGRVNETPTDPDVIDATAAVNAFVETACPSAPRDADGTWAPDTELGALMLAARLVRRRNSAAGVESITDAGVAYVARNDPDVTMLLRLGTFAPPVVG